MAVEPERSATLGRIGARIREAPDRVTMLAQVVVDVREAFGADRCAVYARLPGEPNLAEVLAVAESGALEPVSPRIALPATSLERCLEGEVVRVEHVGGAQQDASLRGIGVAAGLLVPFFAEGSVEAGMSVLYAAPRAFSEVEMVMMRGIAMQVEFALAKIRLLEAETIRRRRSELLERTMLALRDAREPHDVLALGARALGLEFRRPCAAYELRDGAFRPVAASEVTSIREPIPERSLDSAALRDRIVIRYGDRDLVAVTSDGQLRSLFALESAAQPLGDEDLKFLRAIATHAALALTSALSFEQLRRYAAEGAALSEAARTILGFTELEPLADALCKLALRLVHADSACAYGRKPGHLNLVGCAHRRAGAPTVDTLPIEQREAEATLSKAYGFAPLIVVPMLLPDAGDLEHGGLLVVTRRRGAFERAETRVVEALVTLAALAIRNVELYAQSTRANRALAESNAFKDDLMAMFAHDFKGPLTVISGFAELLLETENPESRTSAEAIAGQARRLAKLSEDALALAATQSAGFSLRRNHEDLSGFVRDAVRALDPGGGRIRVDAAEEPVVVPFDRARLRHVIENVVGNALKYSQDEIVVSVRLAAGEALVEVTDRGIGIPAAELERVFTRFGRASNARRQAIAGSGVGLYIAKKIVEVHGGRLEVTSQENVGSTFILGLPLA
jgi:signal transduction histidine kinase